MIEGLKPYPKYRDTGLPWLEDAPAHWTIKRGKSYMTSIDQRSSTGEEELLTVSSSLGVIPRSSTKVTMFKAESYIGYKLCWPGDLVINSLWAWGCGLGESNHHGIISTAYSVYRPRLSSEMNPRFLHELVRSSSFNWELHVRSKGIWKSRLQLTDTSFLNAPIPLPPPDEQAAIVRFLDHANQKIDTFIRAKRKLIGLLNEQKQTIIHRAVTRGLNPDAPFKPSGVDWLGDIPKHWEILRAGRIFREITDTNHPADLLLSIDRRRGVIPQSETGRKTRASKDRSSYKRVQPGDLAYNIMNAFMGSLGFANQIGIVSPAYAVARPQIQIEPVFFHHLLRTTLYTAEFNRVSYGIMYERNRLYFERFRLVPVIVPPLQEQRDISRWIADSTQDIETAISRTEREMTLMQEYRTRLTADIVTGKLDVREAAKTLPESTNETAMEVLTEDLEDEMLDEAELEEINE